MNGTIRAGRKDEILLNGNAASVGVGVAVGPGTGTGVGVGNGKHSSSRSSLRTKVVVVGAGISGVTAAAKLVRNGIEDVVVLEAQDYIGGRIKGQVVGDRSLDMGAMFVHGQEGNPIYEIVHRLGMEAADMNTLPSSAYTSKREKIPLEEVEDLLDLLEDSKGDLPAEVGDNKRELLTNLYHEFLETKQISTDHPKRELYDAAFQFFCHYDCTEEACKDLCEVSAWADLKYVIFDGNQHTLIRGGYSTVMRRLLNLIPKGVIRTRTPVHSIDWRQPRNGGILVQCANGDVITTDHVIVTISMGCLKAVHKTMFSPPLPTAMTNSMERVAFGSIGKIFVKWTPPFWKTSKGVQYDFLWLESHPITLAHDTSKRKTCFGKPWWHGVMGCHSVTDHDDFLLFWMLQHQMEAIQDLDDQEILAVLHELMQVFVCDVIIPKPCAIYRTNWEQNPYTRGTYSYCTPSFDETDAGNLSKPVFPSAQNPRVLFAGESFTMEYMTTTHGAFVTGEHQADTVLKANGVKDTIRIVDAISYD